ncbi:MAG TPA: YceI family protein, partial [Thermoanaerobaculia bacterium]
MKATRQLLALLVVAMPLFAADTFTVDKNHSMATFKVRHMVSNVVGQFRDFTADVNIDRETPAKSSVEFTIQAASIDTGNANRDTHLKSPDFFDVEKFPTITFKSTSIAAKSATEFNVTGDLTMHGVTKRVTLPVTFGGFGKTARGEKAGFEVETTLNRKDYGVLWNKNLDEGGLLLGDDVKVTINLEMDKKVAAAA